MVPIRPLTDIRRTGVELLAGLRTDSPGASKEAGQKLVAQAKDFGLNLRDYLTLAIDLRQTQDEAVRTAYLAAGLNGYEAALAYLNLPVKNDFEHGVVLQAASETFQRYPGTRALFPEVVDDMVRFKYRQDSLERIDGMVSNSRTIAGTEMISTVIDDKKEDYEVESTIPEMARIPVSSIRSTQHSVAIFKHGRGYRTSYEFERRASLDMMTPYAARTQRETDRSKVKAATLTLLNGDGVHAAATTVTQASLAARGDFTHAAGKLAYRGLLVWLVDRAKAGVPVDLVVGNWDAYIQWLMMFAVPASGNTRTDAETLAAAGFRIGGVPILNGVVDFKLSSTMPANKLLGYSSGDTLEELVEAGSLIHESERSILNQTITYTKTESTGYRLVFGDTREVYDFGA